MDAASYTTLTRQSGLMREMQAIANNIANAATTGFRTENVIFSEFVKALEGGEPSLSMAAANVRATDLGQGALARTGGSFDFAIEGAGFFMVEGPEGPLLTRAGAFTPNQQGELATSDGLRLLDAGGAPVFIPPDARAIALAADGTLSADGRPLTRIGLFQPADPAELSHRDGVRFAASAGTEPVLEGSVLLQGFVESSNVDPIGQIARMIEVQRAYEQGQTFLDREDERIRAVLQALGR